MANRRSRTPYTLEKVHVMYRYLQARGELYIIEGKDTPLSDFRPIGDVTFWQDDLPIVIGEKAWQTKRNWEAGPLYFNRAGADPFFSLFKGGRNLRL